MNNIFRDGTAKDQLKLKLCIDADVRCTGFTEGTKGTKREQYFGAITFENDEGTIKGQCSGFNDKQLIDFNSKRDELIGKIMVVQFNDLTKARNSDVYSLSHPRFIEFRDDKDSTDTLERVQELRNMAMELS
jgi:DNA ligase-1